MSDTPAIRLKRGEGHAFKAGGPWIYDNEIAEILGEPADGGIVRIEDYNGYPLGVGFLNRASTIAVRVLSRDAGAVIDRDFLERRVRAAWQYRKDTVDTSSCRVIFGEADFLPGLVVDKFADVLVVESLALGIDRLKSTILSLLVDLLKEDGIFVRGIYERSDAKVRLKEGMERVKGFLSDPFDPVVEIVENGVRYQVDVAEGRRLAFSWIRSTTGWPSSPWPAAAGCWTASPTPGPSPSTPPRAARRRCWGWTPRSWGWPRPRRMPPSTACPTGCALPAATCSSCCRSWSGRARNLTW